MSSVQAHVFVNDEWVTQTVTADDLIASRSHPRSVIPKPPTPPKYGILTRTIIESPITRWVLPVQLRSSRFNDVAFVGDQSVQISELVSDTQLVPIAKKVNFGSRIRNCRVMGTHEYLKTKRHITYSNYQKADGFASQSSNSSTPIPPASDVGLFQQILVLILSEELVFLFMSRTAAGDWEFVSSHHSISSGHLVDPGFHMTISPDGGYLALACSEHLFVVYQLESIQELNRQHSEGLPIQPIKSLKARAVKGIVHKLEFLHPDSKNVSHVVLLIVTIQSGVLKLAVYDWESSEPLQDALKVEKAGHRLDGTIGLPLLIIPLTVCCQFLIITEHSMVICSDILGGPPDFIPFELAHKDNTSWHHGTNRPMWTAWTRPMREELYYANTDLIYIAREDGWMNLLEIIGNSGVETSIYLGPLECNIDSGFASLSTPNGELLIAGGSYGRGTIWVVEARKNPKQIGQLPNWSPTTDLVLTKGASTHSKSDGKKSSKRSLLPKKTRSRMLAPERVFACSGRELSGAIVELRYGIQAKIGLDLLYTSPIKRCWAIPSFDDTLGGGFFMLLALPETSALLHISHDLSDVTEKSQNEVKFDLLSPTLAVYVSKGVIIQITTMHATITSLTSCYQHSISDLIEDSDDPLATVTDAAITKEVLALSVYSHSTFKVMVFNFNGSMFVKRHILRVEGEVTALSVNTLSASVCVLAGLSQMEIPTLAIFPVGPSQSEEQALADIPQAPINLNLGEGEDIDSMAINAVTSITCHGDQIMVGMRNGNVHTIRSVGGSQLGEDFTVARTNHFGVSPSRVSAGMMFDTGPSTLVCNDAGLAIMKESDGKRRLDRFEQIFRVWLTDANEPHLSSPTINSVARLQDIQDYGDSTWVMVAGAHILITELQPDPGPVPRYIPTRGTPFGVLYSERLEALATIVIKKGIPSLHFFDPITGADLSHPTRRISDQGDERHVDVDYISSLGKPNTKITSLLNWRYKSKGNTYEWFVILAREGDNVGRISVVSAEQEAVVTHTGTVRRIRFWTQFKKTRDGYPRAGATDADGLFLNVGKTVEYHVIEDKRFKAAMKYDLPSPATSLEAVDGHLHVLTAHHSLVILDYKSDAAIHSQRMVQIYTDEFPRNGLHSINMKSFIGIGERQQLILMSNLTCSVYGLWSLGPSSNTSNLQSIFRANLTRSIKKFVHGHTRPRWTKDEPRYGRIQSLPDRHDILGLAVDGSLLQFSILPEDAWRLLRYIQILAVTSEESRLVPTGYDSTRSLELDASSTDKIEMHVDGDILQRCLETQALERIASTTEQLTQLQELLRALDPGTEEGNNSQVPDETPTAYEYAYSILEYYLSSAL
ncbi:mono-functional DNA-alkylating methyl methanesulfonate N-term-domain-containing protein [Nemania abortiva]|nr:mono-functional DNA-alkylating methyl methanesulfonate N-term-domain-containing protein [Nemania abortiva]